MHGHALSGSRKLNRHWQSASKGLDRFENLVIYDAPLSVTEWPETDHPYLQFAGGTTAMGFANYGVAGTVRRVFARNDVARVSGYKPLFITKPGKYQLHWNLMFPAIESFTRDGTTYYRTTGNMINASTLGFMHTGMYGAGQHIIAQSTACKERQFWSGVEYYTGAHYNYLPENAAGTFTGALYSDGANDIVITPSHQTGPLFDRVYLWDLDSDTLNEDIIFNIKHGAPFEQMSDTQSAEYTAPAICLHDYRYSLATSPAGIAVGKVWLERVGNYEADMTWDPYIIQGE